MRVYESVWSSYGIWIHMKAYECILANMMVNESIW